MKKHILLISILLILFSSLVTSQVTSTDTGEFDVPQYDNRGELIIEFIVPFLVVFLLFFWTLRHVLHFTLHDSDAPPWEKPDVNRYAVIISLCISLIIIVSPYWQYLSEYIAGSGMLLLSVLLGFVIFLLYISS